MKKHIKYINDIDDSKAEDKNVKTLANLLNNEENKKLLEEFLFNGAIIERNFKKDDIDLLKNVDALTRKQCMIILVNNPYYTELCTIYKILEAGLFSKEATEAFWKACDSFIYDPVFKRVFIKHPDIKEKNELDIYYKCDINSIIKSDKYNAYCDAIYRSSIDSWEELTEEDKKNLDEFKNSIKTKEKFQKEISYLLFERVMESIHDKIKQFIERRNVLIEIFDAKFPETEANNKISVTDFQNFCKEKQGKIDGLNLPDWFIEKEELNSGWNNELTTDYMDFIYYLRTKFLQKINEGITAEKLLDLIKKESKETKNSNRIFYTFKYGEDKEIDVTNNLLESIITIIRGSDLSFKKKK